MQIACVKTAFNDCALKSTLQGVICTCTCCIFMQVDFMKIHFVQTSDEKKLALPT